MTFRLDQWEKAFPDGVSLATYQRISRVIRNLGGLMKISVRTIGDEIDLRSELDRLERKRTAQFDL